MSTKYFFTSLTRISDLAEASFSVERLPRKAWGTGDYVVGEVVSGASRLSRIELANGRIVEVGDGDMVVGAFGVRYATLEAVGGWQNIGNDRMMEALTGAGLFGKSTSRSAMLSPLLPLSYKGHVLFGGEKATMRHYVPEVSERAFETPVVLLVGTSMSAGKTTSARAIVRLLKEDGLAVIGAKLTGAGRYRDILAMEDAGAARIFDFVDAGLPSTVVPEGEYRKALRNLLSRMAQAGADVVVAEVGASPLEPYNGTAAIEEIGPNVRCTVLSASDPYAVAGVTAAFGRRPDLVTGLATSTRAGIELVEKLSGITALNVLDRDSLPKLRAVLERTLGLTAMSEL
jgi:methylmalonyl-CoA mutase cobalamin-binding subunit